MFLYQKRIFKEKSLFFDRKTVKKSACARHLLEKLPEGFLYGFAKGAL